MPTKTSKPTALPAHVLSAEIAALRLSPVDVVDAFLDRIRAVDPKLGSFVEVYAEDARLAAEAAAKAIRSGHAVGPLHGLPVALKDLVEVKGRVTTGGSMAWRDRRSQYTATLANRLIGAGMIVLGKTHSVEFALGLWGTNQHMGTPRNPWDATVPRTPGGSSSGSGVAVAGRLVPWAIGTDTGGSVRLPASFCGTTGLKTTIGRISTYGVLPISPTLDTPGPITRSVEDAAILYQLLHGPDPHDPRTLGQPVGNVMQGLKRGIRGMRLARMPEVEREGVSAEVLASYDRSLEVLAGLGALIEEVPLPRRLDDYAELTSCILLAEGYSIYGEVVEDDRLPVDETVRQRLRSGAGISAREYLAALRLQGERKQEFAAALAGYDALLTPTTWTAALPLDSIDHVPVPARFTRFVNLLELCGISLPNGFTAEGLPTSLQIVCRGHDEATALRIGWAYQAATDWHERSPPGL